uniref:Gustatory receptor n=1 Tax=Eogystia hippophaecolus TaxID=1206364 RepID=A0A1B3P5S9_EOGHI|nr:gustatory receptor [Eogystia hippophaecolus]
MYKSLVLLCVVFCIVCEARPKWQFLPPVPGYVPVYIRKGDTPLEEINPDLAEAFHALPAGRSAGKQLNASPEFPEQADQPQPDVPELPIDRRPYEKKLLEKKSKKASSELTKPIERS